MLKEKIGGLTVGNVLNIVTEEPENEGDPDKSPAMLIAIKDIKLSDMNTALPSMKVGKLLGLFKLNEDGTIVMEDDEYVYVDEDTSAILKAIAPLSLDDLADGNVLKNAINGVMLKDVIDITMDDKADEDNPASPKILQALAETTLFGLSDKLKDLTIGEMVDIEGTDGILYALRNATLETLGAAIDGLLIKDALPNREEGLLARIDGDRPLSEIQEALGDAMFGDDANVTLGDLHGMGGLDIPDDEDIRNTTLKSLFNKLLNEAPPAPYNSIYPTWLEFILNFEG